MAINLKVSENQERVPLRVGNGSPYYVGARAYVTQTADGATITVIDKEGTTTADIYNGQGGAAGQDGADGFSPTATVTKSGDTATISITDINGTTTETVADGADGYSPSASVTKVGSTATITITDKDGTTTASISDGSGGSGSAFVAEYNVTSYADVKAEYDNDAILICTVDDSGNTMVLQFAYFDVSNEIFFFATPMSDGWFLTQLSNADGWEDSMFYFASTDVATQLADGLMSALDKQKLDGLSITDTYDGTSSNGMSGKAVKSAIDALDGTVSGTAGAGKTLTAFSQTDGKVSATFDNISITKSQISDFPTIPTVNNATLTIQKNGNTVNTFTANASSNVTANITVPTNVSDLNNDSGFLTLGTLPIYDGGVQ